MSVLSAGKRLLLILGAVFLLAPLAAAQVSVTGTITDPNGIPYSNAAISFQLVPSGTNPCVTPAGGSTCQSIAGLIQGTTSSTGSFSVNLYCNSTCTPTISPSGTQWQITVSTFGVPLPFGTGPQSFSTSVTISAAINLSATLSALAPALTFLAGSTSVVPTLGPGKFYVSTNCLGLPNCYTVHDDGQAVSDAGFTAGSGTVTTGTNDPPFCNGTTLPCSASQIARGHTTDVGIPEAGFDACHGVNEMICGYNCAQGTITGIIDAHTATVSPPCTRTSSVTPNSNNFYWVQDDSTALTAAWTAAQNYAQFIGPATIQLPCGKMGMGTQSFVYVPAVGGPIHYATGMDGCGAGNPTEIIPFPKMNCTGGAGVAKGCLLIASYEQAAVGNFSMNQSFQNILFNGYGLPDADPGATVTAGESGIFAGFLVNLTNVAVQGWYGNRPVASPIYGLVCDACSGFGVNLFAGGNFGVFLEGQLSVPGQLFGGSVGGSLGPSIDIGPGETSTHGVYVNQNQNGCFVTSTCYGVRNLTSGSQYSDFGSEITTGLWNDAGAKSSLFGSKLIGDGAYTLYLNGGTVALQNVTTDTHANIVAGTLLDLCGNTVTGGFGTMTGLIVSCPTEPSIPGQCLLASAASPLACVNSANGKVAVPATTTTYTINTTAITTGHEIFITPTQDNSGISGAPTCAVVASPFAQITAISTGTSFTFSLPSNAGISCFNWSIR